LVRGKSVTWQLDHAPGSVNAKPDQPDDAGEKPIETRSKEKDPEALAKHARNRRHHFLPPGIIQLRVIQECVREWISPQSPAQELNQSQPAEKM
jgi:hypothetical protein